jgi:hypothetical protein
VKGEIGKPFIPDRKTKLLFLHTDVTDDDKMIRELEREAREADRMAAEARAKAQALKERLELAKQKKRSAH